MEIKIWGGNCHQGKGFFLEGGKCPNMGVVIFRILVGVNVHLQVNNAALIYELNSKENYHIFPFMEGTNSLGNWET